MITLRPWQGEALQKAIDWFGRGNRDFLINAAPGTGKTICASVIASNLIDNDEIDRVIVIAPRREIVNQWSEEFRTVTKRPMMRVTGSDSAVEDQGVDCCATWASVQGLADGFQQICRQYRTLVICDEHHHAAINATWGKGTIRSFEDARFTLVLTGTPIRSDGGETAWLAYNDIGELDHDEAGSYTISYGTAVDLGYCRPITFHRHEGQFDVVLRDGEKISVSGTQETKLPKNLEKIEALQRVLNYYHLACTPTYEADGKTPQRNSYQASMLEWGISKLNDLRYAMPNAAGLIIAPRIELANYMAELLEILDGEKPIIVHTDTTNPAEKIRVFRNSKKRWIVSVGMISEGVDIKRLRVLIYLPYAQTELALRQAMGRVVRTTDEEEDFTRAYVVVPTHQVFEDYARRVELEMPPLRPEGGSGMKICPVCGEENEKSASECSSCGFEFPPPPPPPMKECEDCGALNPIRASKCQECGASFRHEFEVKLSDAFRMGTIIRGADVDEELTQEGEKIAPELKKLFLNSGDEVLIDFVRKMPEESMGRAEELIREARRRSEE